jgi:2-phosphosulfolactate phosphatase
MRKQVIIDCFPESARKYRKGYAVVAVDVIRATTSAITVAAKGGRCLPVPSLDAAFQLKTKVRDPLMAGEIAGALAPGFDLNNSPSELGALDINGRTVILLSSSGTSLIDQAKGCEIVHLACFRNYAFVARHLAGLLPRVAVIGAGSRGEFREEDQMCCAWIARDLAEMGYAPADELTFDMIKQWATEPPEAALCGKSAEYLRRSGQTKDLEFILAHINDLRGAYEMRNGQVVALPDYGTRIAVTPGSVMSASAGTHTVC